MEYELCITDVVVEDGEFFLSAVLEHAAEKSWAPLPAQYEGDKMTGILKLLQEAMGKVNGQAVDTLMLIQDHPRNPLIKKVHVITRDAVTLMQLHPDRAPIDWNNKGLVVLFRPVTRLSS